MVHQGRARVTYLKSTCSGFWRLLLLSLSDSALVLAAAWRFNFSREALTSPCHRTKNIARCTRANIHPSRIPRLALSPLPSALAPPLSLVPRRIESRRIFRFFVFFVDMYFVPAFSARYSIYRLSSLLETGLREDTGDILSSLERAADC